MGSNIMIVFLGLSFIFVNLADAKTDEVAEKFDEFYSAVESIRDQVEKIKNNVDAYLGSGYSGPTTALQGVNLGELKKEMTMEDLTTYIATLKMIVAKVKLTLQSFSFNLTKVAIA